MAARDFRDGYFCREVSDVSMDARNDQDTQQEVEFCLGEVPTNKFLTILDVGAGLGRHSIPFAQRGHTVTAVEASPDYIDEGKKRASASGVTIAWQQMDARGISDAEKYDLAISLYTSFGYHSDTDNIQVLRNIQRALKPGGIFVLEMTTRDALCRSSSETKKTVWGDDGECVKNNEFDLLSSRRVLKWDFFKSGVLVKTVSLEHRLYAVHELVESFKLCGLSPVGIYSDFNKNPISHEDRKIVMVGKNEA